MQNHVNASSKSKIFGPLGYGKKKKNPQPIWQLSKVVVVRQHAPKYIHISYSQKIDTSIKIDNENIYVSIKQP
jgi:hypothetical protein